LAVSTGALLSRLRGFQAVVGRATSDTIFWCVFTPAIGAQTGNRRGLC
jgi:hypothetical protein